MNGNAMLKAQTRNKLHCGSDAKWEYYASESVRNEHNKHERSLKP